MCETCDGPGTITNHNCLSCISDYRLLFDEDNPKNCYENCTYNYYFDNSNVYHCTYNEECPGGYSLKIPEKRKCINDCNNDNTYKHEYHNRCYNTPIIETTQILETTQIPLTTQIPETTHILETTQIPETTQILKTSQIPKTTQIPKSTEISENIQIPETTQIPEITHNLIESTSIKERTSSPEEDLYDCFNENSLINKCVIKDNYTNEEIHSFIATTILSSYSSSSLKSLVFEGEGNDRFQIGSLKGQLDLFNNKNLPDDYIMSIIDLGECENRLK